MSFSSFRKPGTSQIQSAAHKKLPATRVSAHNGQTLTSTGIPSLDDTFGGGLPLGSLLLIKEDRFTGYAMLALKYYMAQGIASNHAILFASGSTTANTASDLDPIFSDLMAVVKPSAGHEQDDGSSGVDYVPLPSGSIMTPKFTRALGALRSSSRGSVSAIPSASSESSDQLDIAWRYQAMPKFNSQVSNSVQSSSGQLYCRVFDLTKRIDPELLTRSSIQCYNGPSLSVDSPNMFRNLLEKIQSAIVDGGFSTCGDTEKAQTLLRIAIRSFVSPEWTVSNDPESLLYIKATCLFLHSLKSILRNTQAVCVVTVPAYLYEDFYRIRADPLIRRLEYTADAVIEIESFAGSPKPVNPLYATEYHGLIHPHRTFGLNSHKETSRLSPVELHSLAFKVRRKRFLIETFTLPPEDAQDESNESKSAKSSAGQETNTSRQHSSSIPSGAARSRPRGSGPSCGASTSGVSSVLDF
ncbi:hypothetical protein BDV3_004279 [Batrachochytrium dendrobatidis]